ncbi:hypothetical protein L2E82_01022 [Cichorium intybus]|uniref:Uncharacterized protein n=1 Tax=Cichorium intybus TaxID=13427 RepID=A0ACB9GZW4_CICIN|nr:hypothetical protein L2E82_01022 [Cichorium intybus]
MSRAKGHSHKRCSTSSVLVEEHKTQHNNGFMIPRPTPPLEQLEFPETSRNQRHEESTYTTADKGKRIVESSTPHSPLHSHSHLEPEPVLTDKERTLKLLIEELTKDPIDGKHPQSKLTGSQIIADFEIE